jgi:hypothetical protein
LLSAAFTMSSSPGTEALHTSLPLWGTTSSFSIGSTTEQCDVYPFLFVSLAFGVPFVVFISFSIVLMNQVRWRMSRVKIWILSQAQRSRWGLTYFLPFMSPYDDTLNEWHQLKLQRQEELEREHPIEPSPVASITATSTTKFFNRDLSVSSSVPLVRIPSDPSAVPVMLHAASAINHMPPVPVSVHSSSAPPLDSHRATLEADIRNEQKRYRHEALTEAKTRSERLTLFMRAHMKYLALGFFFLVLIVPAGLLVTWSTTLVLWVRAF